MNGIEPNRSKSASYKCTPPTTTTQAVHHQREQTNKIPCTLITIIWGRAYFHFKILLLFMCVECFHIIQHKIIFFFNFSVFSVPLILITSQNRSDKVRFGKKFLIVLRETLNALHQKHHTQARIYYNIEIRRYIISLFLASPVYANDLYAAKTISANMGGECLCMHTTNERTNTVAARRSTVQMRIIWLRCAICTYLH